MKAEIDRRATRSVFLSTQSGCGRSCQPWFIGAKEEGNERHRRCHGRAPGRRHRAALDADGQCMARTTAGAARGVPKGAATDRSVPHHAVAGRRAKREILHGPKGRERGRRWARGRAAGERDWRCNRPMRCRMGRQVPAWHAHRAVSPAAAATGWRASAMKACR